MMDLVGIARKLISIPSYVHGETDERPLGEFIYDYLQGVTTLKVEKQEVENGRFNVIAHDDFPPRLMFGCHLDTVLPSSPEMWSYGPFDGEIVDGRLYGLGACDMKGGIASLLYALTLVSETRGLFLLFDVDEEYYFKGMQKFLESYEITPDIAVFTEPGMDIQNGHRGLIEVSFRVNGITGHASRPHTGKNAIWGTTQAVEHLIQELEEYTDPALGISTCNLAFLQGGINGGEDDSGILRINKRPNQIPDVAEVVLDIRPATGQLRADAVLNSVRSLLTENGFTMTNAEKKLDYGSLLIAREKLSKFESVVKEIVEQPRYADIGQCGYGEAQLLHEKTGVNCVYFGPGPRSMAHQVDEFVSLSELGQASKVYKRLIETYCGFEN